MSALSSARQHFLRYRACWGGIGRSGGRKGRREEGGTGLIFQRQRRGREGGERGHERERGRPSSTYLSQGGSAIEECTGPFLKPLPLLHGTTCCTGPCKNCPPLWNSCLGKVTSQHASFRKTSFNLLDFTDFLCSTLCSAKVATWLSYGLTDTFPWHCQFCLVFMPPPSPATATFCLLLWTLESGSELHCSKNWSDRMPPQFMLCPHGFFKVNNVEHIVI